MGFSRNKACNFIGLAPGTLSNWVKDDEALGMKLTGWENAVNTVVMQNLVQAIKREGELEDDIRKENSWKWAERRMKDDFSLKTEADITSGGKPIIIDHSLIAKNDTHSITKDNSEGHPQI